MTDMIKVLVRVSSLTFKCKKRVLFENLSFSIGKGITVIEGKSGVGKSSLMKMMAGFIKPTTGTVERNYSSFSYLSAQNLLVDYLTVEENVLFLKDCKTKGIFDEKVFDEELSNAGLEDVYRLKAGELSDGEKRLVSFLICISYEADIYYFDEPFNFLDERRREFVYSLIKRLSLTSGVVLINHVDKDKLNNSFILKIDLDNGCLIKGKEFLTLEKKKTEKTNQQRGLFSIQRKILKSSLSWPILSVLIAFLFCSCLIVSVSSFPLNDESLEQKEVNSDPYEYLNVNGNTQGKSFAFDEYRLSIGMSDLLYSEDFHLEDGRSLKMIIDSSLEADSIYYYQSVNKAPVIDIDQYSNPCQLNIVREDTENRKRLEEEMFSFNVSAIDTDSLIFNPSVFSSLLKNGLLDGFVNKDFSPLVTSSYKVSGLSPFENGIPLGDLDLKIEDTDGVIGIDGVDIGRKIRWINNISFMTNTSFPSSSKKTLHLSPDVLTSLLASDPENVMSVSKRDYVLAKKNGFKYCGEMTLMEKGNEEMKIVFTISSLLSVFMFMVYLIINILAIFFKKDPYLLYVSSLDSSFIHLHKRKLNISIFFSLVLIVYVSSLYYPLCHLLSRIGDDISSLGLLRTLEGSRFVFLEDPVYFCSVSGIGFTVIVLLPVLLFLISVLREYIILIKYRKRL